MKKYLLAGLGFAMLYNHTFAQTNTFPSSGNAGIGTTNPSRQLNVNQLAGGAKGILISGDEYYSSGNGDANGVVLLLGVNRSGNRQLWLGDNTALGSSLLGLFRCQSGTTLPSMDAVTGDGLTRLNMTLGSRTSKVGIGIGDDLTSQPANKLTVVGNMSVGEEYYTTAAPSNGLIVQGNVGIGTTNPLVKLAVNGTICATKVKVTTQGCWADYVFHANYRLRPLSEVEQYIKQHHHLPEVPSAEEVEKNGIDVGDNQATLLKKIEELTLYVIDQDKQIKKLTNENRALEILKKEMEELKAAIYQK